ncbi:MAG: hypothetical protein AMK70_04270 [Nitrospira bacterium SG8_35_1]|nr:MAG: hypothetical protein AMK70_04270 [Nitrospira bacterium SG8_35_1]
MEFSGVLTLRGIFEQKIRPTIHNNIFIVDRRPNWDIINYPFYLVELGNYDYNNFRYFSYSPLDTAYFVFG